MELLCLEHYRIFFFDSSVLIPTASIDSYKGCIASQQKSKQKPPLRPSPAYRHLNATNYSPSNLIQTISLLSATSLNLNQSLIVVQRSNISPKRTGTKEIGSITCRFDISSAMVKKCCWNLTANPAQSSTRRLSKDITLSIWHSIIDQWGCK